MPVRTVVIYLCSLCGKEVKNEADIRSFTLVPAGTGPKLHYDVCSACMKKGPMAQVIAAGEQDGRKRSRERTPRGKPGKYKCPDCSYSSDRPQSLGVHRARVHGYVGVRKASRQ